MVNRDGDIMKDKAFLFKLIKIFLASMNFIVILIILLNKSGGKKLFEKDVYDNAKGYEFRDDYYGQYNLINTYLYNNYDNLNILNRNEVYLDLFRLSEHLDQYTLNNQYNNKYNLEEDDGLIGTCLEVSSTIFLKYYFNNELFYPDDYKLFENIVNYSINKGNLKLGESGTLSSEKSIKELIKYFSNQFSDYDVFSSNENIVSTIKKYIDNKQILLLSVYHHQTVVTGYLDIDIEYSVGKERKTKTITFISTTDGWNEPYYEGKELSEDFLLSYTYKYFNSDEFYNFGVEYIAGFKF